MFGSLIGDFIGSFWEFSGNKDPHIPLWVPACRFTDDSVCTGAIAQWLLDGGNDLTPILHVRGHGNLGVGYGNKMMKWIMSDNPKPYQSWGNGSAMRASPIALWAENETDLLDLAAKSALPTHDHPDAIRGAQATAWAIRQAFIEQDGQSVLAQVEARFDYPGLTTLDPVAERHDHRFDVSCNGTVPLALAIAVRAGSFDEAMRLCCSMGGDADTLAAIAGPLCEALYGIPAQHMDNARLRFHEDDDIWEVVERLYLDPGAQARLAQWGKSSGTVIEEIDTRRVVSGGAKFK